MGALESLSYAYPELTLAIGAMALLIAGVFLGQNSSRQISVASVLLLLIALGLTLFAPVASNVSLFDGAFRIDDFAVFSKVIIFLAAAIAILMSEQYLKGEKLGKFEYPVLILLAALGMSLMVSAGDLISLYMGLETQSLALYILASFNRDSRRSTEAGLKYFVLGALSSGLLLYGASLIYGFTGSTSFAEIARVAASAEPNTGLVVGLDFLISGLAFKVSAAPFHMWTPDVYEGAPTPVTAFFAAAPKLAAMALTVRVLISAFPAVTAEWRQIVVFLAIASMALGAFAAIGQTNIKRLMAYSSIGHMGYALVGLAAGTAEGVAGVVFYLAIYLAMTLGTFACILAMRRDGRMVEDIDALSGLSRTNPSMAFLLAMLLFSLAGIPPLAGFFAKFYVFLAAIHAGLYALAVIGVLLSVVGAYYYLRIIKIMYFDAPAERFEPMPLTLAAALGLSGIFVLVYSVYPAPLVEAAGLAAKSLF